MNMFEFNDEDIWTMSMNTSDVFRKIFVHIQQINVVFTWWRDVFLVCWCLSIFISKGAIHRCSSKQVLNKGLQIY